jgi:hypothetical protein
MTAAEKYRLKERNSAHKPQLLPVALVRCAYMLDMEDIGGISIANAQNGRYIERETRE